MVFKAVALLFGLLAAQSSAQVVGLGGCPDVAVLANFDAARFTGLWYEQQKYFFIFQAGGTCTTAEYGATDQSNVVSVNNTMINFLGYPTSVTGTATLEETDDLEAKLQVKFVNNPITAPYWVLGTDYDNYAVVWSCVDVGSVLNSQSAWILTRQRNATEEVLTRARRVLTASNLSTGRLRTTDQTNC